MGSIHVKLFSIFQLVAQEEMSGLKKIITDSRRTNTDHI